MARGWLGAGILIIFLIAGFVTAEIMDSTQIPTEQLLSQAAEKTLNGDFEEAVALGQEAKARWDKYWNSTATVADHSPMDDVDALFAEMEIYAKTKEEPHFAACCKELAQRIQAVAEAHRFSWWNILSACIKTGVLP